MLDRVLAVLAVALLAAFLGILAWKLQRLDLGLLVIGTLVLVVWDFFVAPQEPQ
ncbi:hypothetical protein [Polymorphum gilvum]|uniref:hypothetical protein n=1 Tax=Polymorphum gilvum TaxID=991904 RepID=UPI0002D8085F|nr:hypothetical protein [Polymorphum gilvum]